MEGMENARGRRVNMAPAPLLERQPCGVLEAEASTCGLDGMGDGDSWLPASLLKSHIMRIIQNAMNMRCAQWAGRPIKMKAARIEVLGRLNYAKKKYEHQQREEEYHPPCGYAFATRRQSGTSGLKIMFNSIIPYVVAGGTVLRSILGLSFKVATVSGWRRAVGWELSKANLGKQDKESGNEEEQRKRRKNARGRKQHHQICQDLEGDLDGSVAA
ncbi:hypothetical protein B0H13DRAFT_1890671 [Mycena leptocephala]|nr:hypothetical protein B0H13DRAFT_1890671 [Mycena leptocephala]